MGLKQIQKFCIKIKQVWWKPSSYKALFPGIDKVGVISVTFSIKCSNSFQIFFILKLIILNATLIEIVPAQDYFSTITPDTHHVKEYKRSQDWITVYTHQFNMTHNCLWELFEAVEAPPPRI